MAIDFYKFIDDINKEPDPSPLFSPETPPVEDVSYNYTKDMALLLLLKYALFFCHTPRF